MYTAKDVVKYLKGFDVTYIGEDRPCATCGYEIRIPPQGE